MAQLITIARETTGKTKSRHTVYLTLDCWRLLNEESERQHKPISRIIEEIVLKRYAKKG